MNYNNTTDQIHQYEIHRKAGAQNILLIEHRGPYTANKDFE